MRIPTPGSFSRRFGSPWQPLIILLLNSVLFIFLGIGGTLLFQLDLSLDIQACFAAFLVMVFFSFFSENVRMFGVSDQTRVLNTIAGIRLSFCLLSMLAMAIYVIRRTIAA